MAGKRWMELRDVLWDFSSSKHSKAFEWPRTTTPWRIGHIFLIRILSIFRSLVQLQSKFDQVLQVLLRQRRAYLIYMDKESNVDYKTSRCKVTCLIQISCCFGYGISLQMPFQMPSPQRKRLLHWYRFDRLIDTRSAEAQKSKAAKRHGLLHLSIPMN